jgi:periplasmic divalent cation tolerance protein
MKEREHYVVVYSTFPDLRTAKRIINGLVTHKLAACGSICKLHSIYVWQGTTEQHPEYGAFIKTKKRNYKKIETYIKKHHPYEVPEIVCWGIDDGLSSYLKWVADETL